MRRERIAPTTASPVSVARLIHHAEGSGTADGDEGEFVCIRLKSAFAKTTFSVEFDGKESANGVMTHCPFI